MSESLTTPTKRKNKPGAGRPREGINSKNKIGYFRASIKDMAFIAEAAAEKSLSFSAFALRSAIFVAEKILNKEHND